MKVTWWLDTLPSMWLDRISDEALLETIRTSLAVARALRRGGELPAVGRMWQNHELALMAYGCVLSIEANHKRGLDADFFADFGTPGRKLAEEGRKFELPPWHDDEDVHISHIASMSRGGFWRSDAHRVELDEEDGFWPTLWPVAKGSGYELMVSKKDREAMAVDDMWLPDDVRARVVNLDG